VPIAPQTWQKLLDSVYEMNSAESHSSFGEAVVAGLSRIVVADVVVFQVPDRGTGRILTHMSPPEPFTEEEVAYYTSHSEVQPLSGYYTQQQDPMARRVSEGHAIGAPLGDRPLMIRAFAISEPLPSGFPRTIMGLPHSHEKGNH
jgi:hypothetical protein